MIDSTDIIGRKNQIKDFVAAARLEEALKHLMDFIRDFCDTMEDEAVILSMDYYELLKEERLEIVPYDDAKRTKRKLAYRMLQTLNSALSNGQAA